MKKLGLIIALCVVNILVAVDLGHEYIMMSEQLDRFNALLKDQALDAESKRAQLSQAVEDAIKISQVQS